jgi:hypothetical protein
MNFKSLRQFGQCLVTGYRCQRYFGFEYRRVVRLALFAIFCSISEAPTGGIKR